MTGTSVPIDKQSMTAGRITLAARLMTGAGIVCLAAALPAAAQQAGIRGTFETPASRSSTLTGDQEAAAQDGEQDALLPRYEPYSQADGTGDDPVNLYDLNGSDAGATDDAGAGNVTASPAGPTPGQLRARRRTQAQSAAERTDEARTDRMTPTGADRGVAGDDDIETASIRALPADALGTEDDAGIIRAENTAIEGRDLPADDDPFAPLGIRL